MKKLPQKKSYAPLAVPLSLKILKKCIEYRIDGDLIRRMHFFDLQCIIIQFDIQKVQEYLDSKEKQRLNSQGISEVRQISGNEALRFLKGGSNG